MGALNTLVGAESGRHLIDGAEDTYIGYQAGFTDTSGEFNTFVGWGAGYSNDRRALAESDNFGLWNTMEGYECGYKSRYGFGNNFYGKAAGYWDNGFRNCMFGAHAGDGGYFITTTWLTMATAIVSWGISAHIRLIQCWTMYS